MNILLGSDYISEKQSILAKNYLILFLLWPFVAFVCALTNYSSKVSRRVVLFFFIYYGLFFVTKNEGVDAFRYAMKLAENAQRPFSDFFNVVGGLYSDTSVDVIEPLISFIVSRFTNYPGALFAAYAALFGFFYLKSINKLHDAYKLSPGMSAFIHMAFFAMILPITSINGFRMWTAAWIFFYGAYNVVCYRNRLFLLVALSASLVHFSFLTANVILFAYYFVGNRNYLYLPILAASFILPELLAPTIETISHRLGGSIADRYDGYSNREYGESIKQARQQASWFMKLYGNLLKFYIIGAVFLVRYRYKRYMNSTLENNLFSFVLIFLSFVNFGSVIPSLGDRFFLLFFMFSTAYLFHFHVKQPGREINIITLLGIFPMLLFVAINFRVSSESINSWILMPGFGLPFFKDPISLAELLF